MTLPKAKKGRPTTPRKRLGHIEKATVRKLTNAIKEFKFNNGDHNKGETKLNSRLIEQLRAVDSGISNKNIACAKFIGETYRPECTLSGKGPYVLFALECKKLHDHSAKRLFKEGLAQANLYLTRSKVVALVLYDFTTGSLYRTAFGRGNTDSSRFARRLREDLGLHILVISP